MLRSEHALHPVAEFALDLSGALALYARRPRRQPKDCWRFVFSAMIQSKYFQEWFSNPRKDIIAGTVVALALIPEAIAFSIIAGVDPAVGLYASFCIAVVIAFLGVRA